MTAITNEQEIAVQLTLTEEDEVQKIIQHWIRILNIKLGWIHDFDKLVVNYVMFHFFLYSMLKLLFVHNHYLAQASNAFMLDTFRSSAKLIKSLTGHVNSVYSIDYFTFDDNQLICSGSVDRTVRIWDVETNKQIQTFNGHSFPVYCAKFSPYHYYYHHRNVICSSSNDNSIYFWDFKNNQQSQLFNEHNDGIGGIEFSSFNGGRYLCSGSFDKTIRLWDVETCKLLHVFNGHKEAIWCVDISPLQSNNNNGNKINSINEVGGNGYTICSGSCDNTVRIWDIETAKQLVVFEGHKENLACVKYGTNELGINSDANTILSGSNDKSVRLWDIRSGQQIQVFNGHTDWVNAVEYLPFVINNDEIGGVSSVICSGSTDGTIRFWDIRSNKHELHMIKGDCEEDNGISSLKFFQITKKGKESKNNDNYSYNSKNYFKGFKKQKGHMFRLKFIPLDQMLLCPFVKSLKYKIILQHIV
ncbi:WD-40 repeat protein [Reticulomyxa filosa]|uniref:WD-40 repeat protein n=1 Tax=Reticulomyxa filosa TaxID=46433 RepID=X6LWL4_RETFI|nr:WD-40 repeat protein [Reticulomyxa filosa]|eukprot:ETO05527.1 WD-40 repeat protein [Reticulomyxa filosa]